eukprot:CAMPEP_0170474450 /NCGR_PEP_ID=MMETSP0123-20130129/16236_1 /TAXON_ID=182087 /ORGANISM="Favella ehrenbergii, Strain Fehren 1" /LENGTH=34 /DNA_ID= /DNA_START= /DNA_END= /DNA_ORIENTATION=
MNSFVASQQQQQHLGYHQMVPDKDTAYFKGMPLA